MKKRVLAALMAMLMVVGMVGCGNNNAPEYSSEPSVASEPSVYEPEAFQSSPEAEAPNEVESEDVTDENSEGAIEESFEASSQPEETTEPEDDTNGEKEEEDFEEWIKNSKWYNPHGAYGLIIATFLVNIQSGTCDVIMFNPDTGSTDTVTSFKYQSDSEYSYFFATSDKFFGGSNHFDSSYTKIAAMRTTISNSETHAGWLTDEGEFFDVTEAVGMASQGEFADPVKHLPVGFTDDGYFVFCFVEGPGSVHYYSVPKADVSPDTLTEGYVMPHSVDSADYTESFNSYAYPSDWLDGTHCIMTTKDSDPTTSVIFDVEAGTKTSYIPGNSRVNWNGRLNPTGTQIAFTSKATNGSDAPDIFIVSVDGGEPVRVPSHDFVLTDIDDDIDMRNIPYGTRSCILVDWQ